MRRERRVPEHGEARPAIAGTFSIVARDPKTRELGVAVQSHYFSVGSAVPWAKHGVGAVATQSFVELSYGPRGIRLMQRGDSPATAIRRLTAADPKREVRQVAFLDATGRAAAWTGANCIPHAGHRTGKNYSAQANLCASPRVWKAMGAAFEKSTGRLADRLVLALEAGQRAGGDARGVQSASLLIVGPGERGKPWTERKADLRVEDHPSPIRELRRLVRLQRAYELGDEAEQEARRGHRTVAEKTYAGALRLAPRNDELLFWRAAMRSRIGDEAGAIRDARAVVRLNPRWKRLLARLETEHFPRSAEVLRALRD